MFRIFLDINTFNAIICVKDQHLQRRSKKNSKGRCNICLLLAFHWMKTGSPAFLSISPKRNRSGVLKRKKYDFIPG
nr:MAG TPA: hypothetical protein [Caudoviricetes sp.]